MPATAAANSSTFPARSYRPDIDGLRALAIISVVLNHAGVPLITGGFTGVDIFFVISGYLIGGQIYSEVLAGNFSYLPFYQRRAKRILPAFYAVLVFTLLAGLILLSPDEATKLGRDAFAACLSISNIFFFGFANYFDARSSLHPLLMTWSLGVEEQFYAVIPLLLVLIARLRRNLILPAIVAVVVLSFALAWVVVGSAPMRAFYLLPERAWELGIGVALAVYEIRGKRLQLPDPVVQLVGLLGLALMVAPFFLIDAHSLFPGPGALPSVLGAALLIAVPSSFFNRRLLALPPVVFIGRVSYSWYLWHWPILAFLRVASDDKLPVSVGLLAVTAAFALAVLSYFFIEQPFRRSTLAPVTLLKRYALASLFLAAICAGIWMSHGLPQRFPALAQMEASGHLLLQDPCLEASQDKPNLSPVCYGASANRPVVALWGDSHAAALAPGLRALAQAQGHGFAELTKNSCTPVIGATHYIPRIPALAAACLRFNQATLQLLQSNRNITVVVLMASWEAPLNRNWMDGWLTADLAHQAIVPTPETEHQVYLAALTSTVHALEASGKLVILIEDTPNFGFDPMMRVRTSSIPARRELAKWMGSQSSDSGVSHPAGDPSIPVAVALMQEASAQLPGVPLYDLKPAFCETPTRCTYRDGDTLLFADSTHLTSEGAARAVRTIRFPELLGRSATKP